MRTVTLKIRRFDPDQDQRSYWATYPVEVDDKERLLDVLNTIKWTIDGSLTFRRSCMHGVCGSDAMCVNGRNRLACKLLMQDLPAKVTIQPLPAFPIIKDLVVDLDPFFAQYEKILPYLINDAPPPLTERLQTPEQRARFDQGTKCILCACCTSSCPVIWANHQWGGQRRLSTPIAFSSIVVTGAPPRAWPYSAIGWGSFAVAPSSIVRNAVRAASPSPSWLLR